MSFLAFARKNAVWLFAGGLMTFGSGFGQTFFISIFAGEIRQEFDLTDGEWGGIYTAGTLISAAMMMLFGGLVDRVTSRTAACLSIVGLGLVCLAMAANTTALVLIGIVFGLRFFGQGMAGHIAMVSAARWFSSNRGRAVSLISLGFSFGEALLPIIFVLIMTAAGWRSAWVVAAFVAFALALVLFRLLRQERSPKSETQASEARPGMLGRHWTRKDMLGHWLFWMILPAYICPSIFSTALFFQQVHLAEVKGWPLAGFVALIPVATTTTIIMMLVSGWLVDRFGSWVIQSIYLLPAAAAYVVIANGVGLEAAALGLFLHGVMQGMSSTLAGTFWPEFFGTRHIGSIRALAMSVMVFGSALGPGVTGYLIDQGIPFPDQMVGIAIIYVVACAICAAAMFRARRLIPAAA